MGLFPKSCYGVDLSEDRVIVVRAARGRRGLAAAPELDVALPAGRPQAQAAFRRLAGAGLLSASLPVHESFLRRLTAPFPSVAKAQRVFPSLLDLQLPFPLEACACRFLDAARTGDGQVEALAVAARGEDLEAARARAQAAGFDPHLLEHEAVALWAQSLAERLPAAAEIRLVFYLGTDRAALAAGRGRRLLFAHGIRGGAARFFADPAGAEALAAAAARLGQVVRAQLPDAADEARTWALAGPGLEPAGAADRLRAALGRPGGETFFTHERPAEFLARALALRAARGEGLAASLRHGALEHPDLRAARARGQRRGAAAALAAGLLLCAVNLGWLARLDQRNERAQARLAAAARHLTGAAAVPRGQELLVAQRHLEGRAPALAEFEAMLQPAPVVRLVPALAAAGQRGVTLESATVRTDALVLCGRAGTEEAVDQLAAALRAEGWAVEVERDPAAAGLPAFTLKGSR